MNELDTVVDASVAPAADAVDRESLHPAAPIKALCDIGAFGVQIPVEFGGLGFDNGTAAAMVERVARGCASTAAILMFHCQVVARTLAFADDERRADDLVAMARGDMIAASAWTEPFGAARKTDLQTVMRPKGDRFAIDGVKSFCTGLTSASVVDVLLRAEDVPGAGPTFVRVDMHGNGVKVANVYRMMGLRGTSTGTIVLEGAPVAEHDVLSGFGTAPALMRANHQTPLNPGLIALGAAAASLDFARRAYGGRVDGVPPRAKDPHSRRVLAEAATKVEAMYAYAAALVRATAVRPESAYGAASRLKAHLTDASVAVTRDLLGGMGSLGFMTDLPLERHLRDAQATALMGPVNGMCRDRIADELLIDAEEDARN
ncbi:acyl-CoA dehydrogenase family protein [Glycomyces tritici]|uniref:Acyl-CoA dehydrogenase family protein n=2 Tax=Glycomyces tritici TaxID=2665176 RepID=A0ABT7YNC0_9ACTN|nr:acyl-CoA dehydrogenase family protein [Glycomyces tritici]MDN3240119.1 acyl-CoA dehydrogenase family protein [Glycomyces tritici]